MKHKALLALLFLIPSLALAGEPANGTLIMVSGVSVWILLSSGFLLWKEIRKNRGPKQD